MAAQAEFSVFLDELTKLRGNMIQEINATMRNWIEFADQAGLRPNLDDYINHRVDHYLAELRNSAMTMAIDYAIPIKDADVAWRSANPEEAANFPE
jgi:hypothetical protein